MIAVTPSLIADPVPSRGAVVDAQAVREDSQPGRIVERLERRHVESDLTLGEHYQPRAKCQREIDIVRDGQADRAPPGFVAKHREALQLLIDVEKRGRFVEQ